jgi:predicted RNase H-like HicB family nuclease
MITRLFEYDDSYEFFGVHNKCTRDGYEFHEVWVPGLSSVIGGGETLDAAIAAAAVMLTIILTGMQSNGEVIPGPMSQESVKQRGLMEEKMQMDGFDSKFCNVVTIKSVPPGCVPQLSEQELVNLEDEAREIWNTLSTDR